MVDMEWTPPTRALTGNQAIHTPQDPRILTKDPRDLNMKSLNMSALSVLSAPNVKPILALNAKNMNALSALPMNALPTNPIAHLANPIDHPTPTMVDLKRSTS